MFSLETLHHWLISNPDWGVVLSFVMAFAESMIFIGGIIPGSLAITGIGTLAGAEVIPLYPTLIAAILGAIAGDFASFFVGRHFKEQLKDFKIFKKYPQTIAYGEHFFKKHGAKSVFFARFIGPIRAIVPAIAGMLDMKIHQFIIANSLSAIGWSVLFFYPGVLIGRGHENIQKYFIQIIFALLIFVIFPIVIVKTAYLLRRYIVRRYSESVNQFWQKSIKRFSILHHLTPKTHIQEYHRTFSEILVLLLTGLLIFINLAFPIHYHKVDWLTIPILSPFTQHHIFYAFDWIQWGSLFSLFIFWSLQEKQKTLIYICCFMNIFLGPWLFVSPHVFVFSATIATQYFMLRTFSRNRMHLYQFYYIFLLMFWFICTYLVSNKLQMSMNIPLLSGLLIAQMAWMFLRKSPLHLKREVYWLPIIFIEPILQFLRFLI